MNTYALADLHGRQDLFEGAVAAVTARGGGTVVWLGDYVDRGPQSRQIIEALIAGPPEGQEWIVLKGNHEDMMVDVCRGRAPISWWIDNGGGATLVSYGHPRRGTVDLSVVPVEHLDWLDQRPHIHIDIHHLYVHAGVDPTIRIGEQTEKTCLWKRYPKGFTEGHGDFHVVHGHDPFEDGPKLYAGRTDLDTLAWRTGRLVIGVFDEATAGGPVELIEISTGASQPS